MLESLLDNIPDVVIGQGVVNVLTRLAIGDKVALSEDFQLVGHGRFCHAKQVCNIANAHRLAINGEEYADTCGITENLEEVREIVENILIRHLFPLLIYNLLMELLTLAGGGVLFI